MSKHTPGPWEVFHHSIGTGVTSTKAFDVSDVAHCSGFNSRRTRDEELANARLIAAAPELLEVLKEIMSWEENEQMRWAQKARAAIAKATEVKP